MTVNRTPELLEMLEAWTEELDYMMEAGAQSVRIQYEIRGHDVPLTLKANRKGVFIVEPGCKPVPAREWLGASS